MKVVARIEFEHGVFLKTVRIPLGACYVSCKAV